MFTIIIKFPQIEKTPFIDLFTLSTSETVCPIKVQKKCHKGRCYSLQVTNNTTASEILFLLPIKLLEGSTPNSEAYSFFEM